MTEQLATHIAKMDFRSLVENYLERVNNFWTGVLNREISHEQSRLEEPRWFFLPAKMNTPTLEEAEASLIKQWNSSYNHWKKDYLAQKEEAELLLKFIDSSVEEEIAVPFDIFYKLTKEKISD